MRTREKKREEREKWSELRVFFFFDDALPVTINKSNFTGSRVSVLLRVLFSSLNLFFSTPLRSDRSSIIIATARPARRSNSLTLFPLQPHSLFLLKTQVVFRKRRVSYSYPPLFLPLFSTSSLVDDKTACLSPRRTARRSTSTCSRVSLTGKTMMLPSEFFSIAATADQPPLSRSSAPPPDAAPFPCSACHDAAGGAPVATSRIHRDAKTRRVAGADEEAKTRDDGGNGESTRAGGFRARFFFFLFNTRSHVPLLSFSSSKLQTISQRASSLPRRTSTSPSTRRSRACPTCRSSSSCSRSGPRSS